MYTCDKCGRCCRNLNFNDLYNYLNRGDGVCIYLDEATNLCKIYNSRPLICNIDKAYNEYFKYNYSKAEYYRINKEVCLRLKSL